MDVVNIETWEQAAPVLDDLAGSVDRDLMPLLETEGGAPHTIVRQFSCYVDYLGALYTGNRGVGARFRGFLNDVMGQIDPGYRQFSEVLYLMYRNGPVHAYDPKTLFLSDGVTLGWLEYQGERTGQLWDGIAVSHLRLAQRPGEDMAHYLPVSTNCLLEDLKSAIHAFRDSAGDSEVRIKAWRRAAQAFERARHVTISLEQLKQSS